MVVNDHLYSSSDVQDGRVGHSWYVTIKSFVKRVWHSVNMLGMGVYSIDLLSMGVCSVGMYSVDVPGMGKYNIFFSIKKIDGLCPFKRRVPICYDMSLKNVLQTSRWYV
jgi:hypothetical protein